jgi:hypothetical protein
MFGTKHWEFVDIIDFRAVDRDVGDTRGTRGRSHKKTAKVVASIPADQMSKWRNLRGFCWISKKESIAEMEIPLRVLRNVYQRACSIASAMAAEKQVLVKKANASEKRPVQL